MTDRPEPPPPPPLPPPPHDLVKGVVTRIERAIDGVEFDDELLQRVIERPARRETWQEALYLISTIPAALAATLVLSVALPLSVGLVISVIGFPLLIGVFWIFRRYMVIERRRLRLIDREPLEVAYAKQEGSLFARIGAYFTDVQTWKDVGWLLFLALVAFPASLIALGAWLVAIGALVYPLWGWSLPGDATPLGFLVGSDMSFAESWLIIPFGFVMLVVAAWLCAAAARLLSIVQRSALAASDEQLLHGRVSELERTREQSLEQQSSEMSRIERDLHDGAQARLVALAMDLGMAEQKLDGDPEEAKKLVAEARDEAQRTLQELRDLVRGIGPQILRDRGLKAALDPLAARSPIEVAVSVELPERPRERIETAAYFVASEALANAIKHSAASRIKIDVWSHEQWCYMRVSDNGSGGADPEGSGLQGLRARVEAVDGRLVVSSPSGGPTIIDAWLPMK